MNSIRETALDKLVCLFQGQQKGQPESDPYDFTWKTVVRTPLTELERRMSYALAIVENDENKERGVNVMYPVLNLTLEFHALIDVPSDGPVVLNRILKNIQRRIGSDPRLANQNGGTALVISLYENGNMIDPESYADKKVSGLLYLEVRYKHAVHDPRAVVPGTI